MGVVNFPSIEDYWKMDPLYYHEIFHKVSMSYNRFSSIFRCWHFAETQLHNSDRMYKIEPLRLKLVDNFRNLYTVGSVVVVDESMVKFRGRLAFRTYNPAKSSPYGIKIYKLCSEKSYTWSYEIYSGHTDTIESLDKPGSVVVKLSQGLLNEGRVIVADNYYTSVSLATYLKNKNTDLLGTLRKNRKNLPERVVKSKLRRGQMIAEQKGSCITVLKWHDKRDVLMISTCHGDSMSPTITRGVEIQMPRKV